LERFSERFIAQGEGDLAREVLERIAEEDVVRYEQVFRKAELLSEAQKSAAPEAAITIIQKHRAFVSALSDPTAADDVFVPVLEDAAKTTKKARVAFISGYAK
jgi:hypothetical protein